MKVKANESNHIGVTGFSSIDHRIRNKLHLNCEQYVVLDFIIQTKYIEKDKVTSEKVQKQIGIEMRRFNNIVEQLILLKLVDTLYNVDEKALNYLGYEEDFEYLFMVFKKNPGNKAEALKMYKRAIKVTPIRILKQCALNYASAKEGVEKNYFMHLSSFLNPEFKKYMDYQVVVKSPKKEDGKRTAEFGN